MIVLRSMIANRSLSNVLGYRILGPVHFQRAESTVPLPATYSEKRALLLEKLKEELPKPYDGPERDHVNFPRRKRPIDIGKLRMGFLPDEWFTMFYKKTGVTGPYLFGTGLLTFLFSREFYVFEEEFSTGCTLFILFYIALKKFGPSTQAFFDKLWDDELAADEKQKKDAIDYFQNAIDDEKKALWQSEGQKNSYEC